MRVKYLLINLLLLILVSCSKPPRGENEIYIGAITGPETQLLEIAKEVAKKKYDLTLTIVTFEDYIVPNTALAEGDIDANLFQHQPYLDVVLEKKQYPLTAIGKMFIYPVGIYSKKYSSLDTLPMHATIAIPNDPSNAARALLLLEKAGLLTLQKQVPLLALSVQSIVHNPKNLIIKEAAAAQLPRILPDVDAAVINTNYAILAQLYPEKDTLFLEDIDSPFANIVVVKASEKDQPKYEKLMKALHSHEVLEKAKALFHNYAIQAW